RSLGVPRIGRARGDAEELGRGRVRRVERDARHAADELALDDCYGVVADWRAAIDSERHLHAVDVVALDREALYPADLDAAHLDGAADLQALERLTLEVDGVAPDHGARAGAAQPDGRRGERHHEGKDPRADRGIAGFRFHGD